MSDITLFLMVSALQVLIALGLINVWIVRFKKATSYRGAGAQNMKEEFAVYGLPDWSVYVVGFLKMVIAIIMILVLLVPPLMITVGIPAFGLLSVLMLGAIAMHIKVKDSLIKTLPAISMLAMSLLAIGLVFLG